MRKKQPEFRVYKSSTPNGNRKWYIIGRPAGKRIRAWFATKEQAEAEATERNVKMRKLGETVVTLDPRSPFRRYRSGYSFETIRQESTGRRGALLNPSQGSFSLGFRLRTLRPYPCRI